MIFTQFEIPVAHLGPEGHYVPPPARDEDEIQRRQSQRPGNLIAEQQLAGIQIAAETMAQVEAPEDINFMAGVFSVSALNTTWYLYGEGADMEVMRRHVDLPLLVGPTVHDRPTSQVVLRSALDGLRYATDQAFAVQQAVHYGSPRVHDFRPRCGRTLARVGLQLGVIDLGDRLAGSPRVSDTKAQRMVRARSTRRMGQARSMLGDVGNYPSLAALAEPLSPLRVYIGRQAPTGALEAFNEAVRSVQ